MPKVTLHSIPWTIAISLFATPIWTQERAEVFTLGEIVVVGTRGDELTGVGRERITRDETWTFQAGSLDLALNLVPGVVSTQSTNSRRNESDVFVRGFDTRQVPLTIDGVRIYLPADNRLDFGRFLTADIAEIQIQKGYASVIDGPGAMGGSINIVTSRPTQAFEADGGVAVGGRDGLESWNAFLIAGSRQEKYYIQGSFSQSDRDSWSLSGDYRPAPGSLQQAGERTGSDSRDRRVNLKAGFTPNATDEYTLNVISQSGEKGAPLNIYNNPPVPPNSYWRWPWWDVQNLSFLTTTQLGTTSYIQSKSYYNTFNNALFAYDDDTYTSQSNPGRFRSYYDDRAYGASLEFGTSVFARNELKLALHHRTDVHTERQHARPTNVDASTMEPRQTQSHVTWSVAAENTYRPNASVDVVTGISYDDYRMTRAEEFNTDGLFEYPRGGADAFNWQGAVVWRHSAPARLHASVSSRARFPTIFELYSTRFGTATPNPDLGAERATNWELGWTWQGTGGARFATAVFYSDVQDLIQTVVLADTTTQTQNVGNGRFHGTEISGEAVVNARLRIGGNYTYLDRRIRDALLPDLRPIGVPDHKAFLYLAWQPLPRLNLTPSIEYADERWSSVNPAPAFPYVRTGAHTLVNLNVEFASSDRLRAAVGFKNLLDEHYELAWGLPQPGRSAFVNLRMTF